MAEFGDARFENVVEYNIFDIRSFCVEREEVNNIQETLYDILSYAQSLIEDYIWQNECFNLRPCDSLVKLNENEQVSFLEGSTNFGDNVEDEWFIVYLLLSISKKFLDVVVTVKDNDGEFLLIEAADYLPKWLEPDTSENRVFLYHGKLHIIPLPSKPSEITLFPVGKPTVYQALKILKENSEKTIALPWIQDSVLRKVGEYPNKARASFHRVLCYLPASLKYLLEKRPSLIAAAITSFVNRNPTDGKKCQKMKHFSFDCPVPCRVSFTKCLYGQLVKQNYIPDKSAVKMLPEVSSAAYKGHLIGLQLTYGFEILCAEQCAARNGIPEPTTPDGPLWEKYVSQLNHHGYFKNEVVGSSLHCRLMENAKEYFSRNCLNNAEERPNYVTEIEKLLQDMPTCDEVGTHGINEFPPDDDESWLEISPEELESMLLHYGQEGQWSNSKADLKNVVQGMNSFVETISGYEGAEFPSELSEEAEIRFDPEEFMKSVDQLFVKQSKNYAGEEEESSSEEDSRAGHDSLVEDEEYDQYVNAMDKELSSTHIGKSFVTMQETDDQVEKETEANPPDQSKDEESEMKPVDVDLNLVQNFLESYSLQEGMPGPVSNILNSMGIPLPQRLSSSKTDQ